MNKKFLVSIITLTISTSLFAQEGTKEKVREPEARPDRAEAERREKPSPSEIKNMIERSRVELEDAVKNGRQDEAAAIKQRMERMAGALREREQRPKQPEAKEPMERLEHLRQAIEHLHAAGLHEPAERLSEQAREMKRAMAGDAPRPDGGKRPDGDRQIAELRERMMDMQRQMKEFQKHMDSLGREQK